MGHVTNIIMKTFICINSESIEIFFEQLISEMFMKINPKVYVIFVLFVVPVEGIFPSTVLKSKRRRNNEIGQYEKI